MTNTQRNNHLGVTNTVGVLNAPESNFHALAERASDLITHHNERGGVVDEEGMIPHN